jgi:hypothetical protein
MSEGLGLAEEEVVEHDQITVAAVADIELVGAQGCLPAGDDHPGHDRLIEYHADKRLPVFVAPNRGVILPEALALGREQLDRRSPHAIDVGEDHPESGHRGWSAAPRHPEGDFGDLAADRRKSLRRAEGRELISVRRVDVGKVVVGDPQAGSDDRVDQPVAEELICRQRVGVGELRGDPVPADLSAAKLLLSRGDAVGRIWATAALTSTSPLAFTTWDPARAAAGASIAAGLSPGAATRSVSQPAIARVSTTDETTVLRLITTSVLQLWVCTPPVRTPARA